MEITRPRLALVAAISVLALSGCGGGGSASTTAEGSTGGAALGDTGRAPASGSRADALAPNQAFSGKAAQAGQAGQAATVEHQAVIKNGDISITSPDPQAARDRVDDLLTRLRGSVDDEQTVYDKQGAIKESHLVLRVPVASFGQAMDDLEHLGKVVHSSSNAKDVTTEVIDVQQRLKTLRISLRDLNSFQRQARTIDQLLRFENAITQRRGEYQSLKAQRDHLADQTSLSTISLDISVPPVTHPAPAAHHDAGFVSGLRHGWKALSGTVVVTLTAVGAVLPFAVVLVVIGLPLWWLGRRVWRTRPRPAAQTPASD
jgi:uncharacterized protein DUF4349